MKDLKALEILKRMNTGGTVFATELEDGIAELKALQAHKTCDGCKFLVHFGVKNSNRVVCNYPFACIRRSKHEDYYEPKETQC